MLVKVKTLSGTIITVDVEPSDKILKIKEKIEEKEAIPPAQQKLIKGGKPLGDNETVEFHKFEPGETIHLVLALRGGF
jgi:ubiquitin-like protein Nedd8